jgi:hypothetical protein
MIRSSILALGTGLILGAGPAPAADPPGNPLALAEEVAREVADLRGWAFEHPVDKKLYTEDQLRTYILEKLEEEYSAEETDRTQAFLRRIGALPEGIPLRETSIEILLSQIGGFYDPPTRTFYMIQREGVDYGPFMDRVLVAHELTHALDDQVVDLAALLESRERTEDGEFVMSSLVEGSATALMTRYVTRAQASGAIDMSKMREIMAAEEERSRVFFEAPAYFRTLVATYTCGMSFLYRGDLTALMNPEGGSAGDAFLEAVGAPPASSEQILHPEKYWNPATRDDPIRVDDDDARAALEKEGLRVTGVNTAGEILIAVITRESKEPFNTMAAAFPAYWTNRAATGWGGDRFYLLEGDGIDGPGAIWITLWDTPRDREEFLTGYAGALPDPDRSLTRLGDRGAIFVWGLEAGTAERLGRIPFRFTRGDQPWTPGE